MKKSVEQLCSVLNVAQYLRAEVNNNELSRVSLLVNGQNYAKQLVKQWRQAATVDGVSPNSIHQDSVETIEDTQRFDFIYDAGFRQRIKLLKTCPSVVKTTQLNKFRKDFKNQKCLKFETLPKNQSTLLITDYFFHSAGGLAKFYNIQRERKIWWMRYSANPSRFFVEPYDISKADIPPNSQSINIKANYPFGNFDIEHITLINLRDAKQLVQPEDFEMVNLENSQKQLPAVIRSVIDLDIATCALLFDSSDSKRQNTLLLNRNLAPFQCGVISLCTNDDVASTGLQNLQKHISNVTQRAGLRLFGTFFNITTKSSFVTSKSELQDMFRVTDNLGIPYVILLEPQTLQSGLLKLRSRDTTLEETIHISDIPNYLLNIFQN